MRFDPLDQRVRLGEQELRIDAEDRQLGLELQREIEQHHARGSAERARQRNPLGVLLERARERAPRVDDRVGQLMADDGMIHQTATCSASERTQ